MSKYSSVALICFFLIALVQSVPEGRIVGGKAALPDQFPYQVSIKLNGKHKCGGSIISRNYILTAAHCVVDKDNYYMKFPISHMTVQAGTNHRLNGGVIIPVAETIEHSAYISEGDIADIALVRLAKPLTFSKSIQSIELSSGIVPKDTAVVVSGWGFLKHKGTMPDQLQWTVLQSLSRESCYSDTGYYQNKVLCLGHPSKKGICKGDSGGPAVVDNRLVGVVNFVLKKCGTYRPDGSVQVYAYLDWIKKHSDV